MDSSTLKFILKKHFLKKICPVIFNDVYTYACMCGYVHMDIGTCRKKPEEGIRSWSYRQSWVTQGECWEPNSDLLEEQEMLLTTESLQLPWNNTGR